jgi:hypothetical protein
MTVTGDTGQTTADGDRLFECRCDCGLPVVLTETETKRSPGYCPHMRDITSGAPPRQGTVAVRRAGTAGDLCRCPACRTWVNMGGRPGHDRWNADCPQCGTKMLVRVPWLARRDGVR